MSTRGARVVIVLLALVVAAGLLFVFAQPPPPAGHRVVPALRLDDQAADILKVVLDEQPAPYASTKSTFNYRWAEFAMAVLAAERNGYLPREEALARIKGILDFAQKCERRGGFWYDGYDASGKATNRNAYFQSWWLYALIVLKNAYPEFTPQCEKMLSELDYSGKSGTYTGDHMYNPETKRITADIRPDGTRSYEWSLFDAAAGEGRMSYVVYSYVTGDIGPWQFASEPVMKSVEGRSLLGIWQQMNFEFPLMHNEMHDVGYYERSYELWKEATRDYMTKRGMKMVPTKQSPLHATWDDNGFPNTEHRESMSYLTWNLDRDAAVFSAAWIPGEGISRYYDNWNFYWSWGERLTESDVRVRAGEKVVCPVRLTPSAKGGNPAKLKAVIFPVVVEGKPGPMRVSVNGRAIARITCTGTTDSSNLTAERMAGTGGSGIARILGDAPLSWCGRVEGFDSASAVPAGTQWIELSGLAEGVEQGMNAIELSVEEAEGREGSYRLLQYSTQVHPVMSIRSLGRGDADLSAAKGWSAGGDGPASVEIVAGEKTGMKYDFTKGGVWAQLGYRSTGIDASTSKALFIEYNLSGKAKELDVKLVDGDGTTSGARFAARTGSHRVDLTALDFTYYWGGTDKHIDWSKIREVWLVVHGAGEKEKGLVRISKIGFKDIERLEEIPHPGAAMEIIVDGQREGTENPFAFLARIYAVHGYRVCDELLKDEKYLDTLVAWVGPYTNRVSLARVVHNLGATPIEVEYALPEGKDQVRVTDLSGKEIPSRTEGRAAKWTLAGGGTVRVSAP